MDKEKIQKFLKDNYKPLIVVVGGLILSAILQNIDGTFFFILATLMQIGCIVYAVLFYRARNKKKKELKEAEETQKAVQKEEQKAAAIKDFKNTLEANLDNILTVIADNVTTTNFEKGLEQIINKSAIPLTKYDVLPWW